MNKKVIPCKLNKQKSYKESFIVKTGKFHF